MTLNEGNLPAFINHCQVPGCKANFTRLRAYHFRYKICDEHQKADHILKDDIYQRFCQQCGRYHPVDDFDEDKRSCRHSLAKHNQRRKRNRRATAKESETKEFAEDESCSSGEHVEQAERLARTSTMTTGNLSCQTHRQLKRLASSLSGDDTPSSAIPLPCKQPFTAQTKGKLVSGGHHSQLAAEAGAGLSVGPQRSALPSKLHSAGTDQLQLQHGNLHGPLRAAAGSPAPSPQPSLQRGTSLISTLISLQGGNARQSCLTAPFQSMEATGNADWHIQHMLAEQLPESVHHRSLHEDQLRRALYRQQQQEQLEEEFIAAQLGLSWAAPQRTMLSRHGYHPTQQLAAPRYPREPTGLPIPRNHLTQQQRISLASCFGRQPFVDDVEQHDIMRSSIMPENLEDLAANMDFRRAFQEQAARMQLPDKHNIKLEIPQLQLRTGGQPADSSDNHSTELKAKQEPEQEASKAPGNVDLDGTGANLGPNKPDSAAHILLQSLLDDATCLDDSNSTGRLKNRRH